MVKRLWACVKEHKLQDPDTKQYVKPDRKMEKKKMGKKMMEKMMMEKMMMEKMKMKMEKKKMKKMENIFGSEKIRAFGIAKYLKPHLS